MTLSNKLPSFKSKFLFFLVSGKEELEKFTVPSSELHLFLFLSILRIEKALNTFILDCDWRESILPWLDSVLLCFVGVGLKGLSWAVRNLDKP